MSARSHTAALSDKTLGLETSRQSRGCVREILSVKLYYVFVLLILNLIILLSSLFGNFNSSNHD